MKQKPGPLFLICITIMLTIGFPSCGSDYAAFRDIVRVDIFDPVAGRILESPAVTSSDSISLIILTKIVEFSFNHSRYRGTMTEAWATTPVSPLMANEITDIRIFCDQVIYGIEPGNNLSSELQFGYDVFKFSLIEFLEMLPRKGEDYYWIIGQMQVFFQTKPPSGFYTFTVEMEDNNGHVFTATSPTLEWL